jgi:hypothetical protein
MTWSLDFGVDAVSKREGGHEAVLAGGPRIAFVTEIDGGWDVPGEVR